MESAASYTALENDATTRLNGQSLDVAAEKLARLQELMPEVFAEGKLDVDKLRLVLGEDVYVGEERFGLNWPGKAEAYKEIQKRTTATLVPDREGSVNFDASENVFIEGENLEVLRVLQKSYFGKVKMIYIDPPYNTGNDYFVYPDDYSERLEEFKKRTKISNEAGFLNKLDLWKKNTKENGHYHSVWLSMIFPRLYLAKNLLREDGVIFVSIDDTELCSLKLIMDEVFGEENYIDIFTWAKSETPANLSKKSKKVVEYVLCYQRTRNDEKFTGIKKESASSNGLLNQTNPIGTLVFPPKSIKTKLIDQTIAKGQYGTNSYTIDLLEDAGIKNGVFVTAVALKAKFKWSQKNLQKELEKGTTISIATLTLSPAYDKLEYEAEVPPNLINSKVGVGTNENAGVALEALLGKKAFDFPKPVSLLKYLMKFSDDPNGIFMDFFAGSGTLAEAVLSLNLEDSGSRKFVCIQLPHSPEDGSLALLTGFKTISEVTETRIKAVTKKLSADLFNLPANDNSQDRKGYRKFALQPSNFQVWNDDTRGAKDILTQLDIFQQPKKPHAGTNEALVFELILKAGIALTCPIEVVDAAENTALYRIGREFMVLLSNANQEALDLITSASPKSVFCLDTAFTSDDAKSNFHLQLSEYNIELQSI